jgi:hypothetical protein
MLITNEKCYYLFDYSYKDNIWRRLSSKVSISRNERLPAGLTRRHLSTVLIWSQTAATFLPRHSTLMTIGGREQATVDNGTTITVFLAQLIGVALTMTHGLCLFISEPLVGLRLTQ